MCGRRCHRHGRRPSGSSGQSGAATSDNTAAPCPRYHAPATSGTVTAVGSASVTIKTSTGTTTYSVTSFSDIDKTARRNWATSSGDTVQFSTETLNGATVIDKLHAGDETKDRPAGPPAGDSAGG